MDVPEDLVEACRRGESQAFEELIKLTHREVYSLAYRMVGNREDAADVAQDTFIKLLRAIKTFRGDSKFSTWLFTVTSSVAISHLRRRARRKGDVSLDADDFHETAPVAEADDIERRDLKARLDEALLALPLGYRAVVVMKDVYGFSLADVGRQLGITEGAAKVRLFRARQRLKDMLYDPETANSVPEGKGNSRGVS